MAEMRLIVAGAGGRMGRTLIKAIAESKNFTLVGALEDARSPLIGWDAGTQLRDIAEKKMKDLNANDLEAAAKIIEGSARSMGLEIVEA